MTLAEQLRESRSKHTLENYEAADDPEDF